MTAGTIELLRRDCRLTPPRPERSRADLPAAHRELFDLTGPVSAFDGYFRLFGPDRDALDIDAWNDVATWKFAWPERVQDFFCFAETAWGDQYAYRLDGGRIASEAVYFLDALRLEAEPMFSTFEEFLATEFLRNAVEPYDSMLRAAAERLGPIPLDRHLAQTPSQLISGSERIDLVHFVPAVDAMVFNGDIYRQVIEAGRDAAVAGIDLIKDEAGRTRIQVR